MRGNTITTWTSPVQPAEITRAQEIHATRVHTLREQAREALMAALAQLADADRWLTEAAEQNCGGECCLPITAAGHVDSMLAVATYHLHGAHALAHAADERS